MCPYRKDSAMCVCVCMCVCALERGVKERERVGERERERAPNRGGINEDNMSHIFGSGAGTGNEGLPV